MKSSVTWDNSIGEWSIQFSLDCDITDCYIAGKKTCQYISQTLRMGLELSLEKKCQHTCNTQDVYPMLGNLRMSSSKSQFLPNPQTPQDEAGYSSICLSETNSTISNPGRLRFHCSL